MEITCLLAYCRNASCQPQIKLLLETNPEVVNATDSKGNTALHRLIQDATVNLRCRRQVPAYMKATKLLIKKGVNIDAKNNDGNSALVYLLQAKKSLVVLIEEMLKLLVENGASLYTTSGSHVLTKVNCIEIFELVLQQYPPVINIPNPENFHFTLLDEIIKDENFKKNLDFIRLLVTHGTICCDGMHPIDIASENCIDFSIIELLLKKYSVYDINTKNYQSRTLLFIYCEDIIAVKKLISLAADVNILDNTGQCIFDVAMDYTDKSAEVVKILIEKCSDEILIRKQCFGNDYSPIPAQVCDHFLVQYSDTNDARFDIWFAVLRLIFDREIFKDLSMPPEIAAVFVAVMDKLVKFLCKRDLYKRYESVPKSGHQVLKLLIETNKSVLNMQTEYVTYENFKLMLSPVSYVLCSNDCHYSNDCTDLWLASMLKAGFSVSDLPRDEVTPLTAFFFSRHGGSGSGYYLEYFDKFVKLLVENNCNIESMCLFEKNIDYGIDTFGEQFMRYKSEMYLSDALFLAVNWNSDLYTSAALGILLSSWWAPPLSLLTFHKKLQVASIDELPNARDILQHLLPVLAKYGGIPHGTELHARLMAMMEAWHAVALQHLQLLDDFEEFNDQVHELTASPLSLQELCKYEVRHMFAERACEPGTSLPGLLHQNLPPLLRGVVIH